MSPLYLSHVSPFFRDENLAAPATRPAVSFVVFFHSRSSLPPASSTTWRWPPSIGICWIECRSHVSTLTNWQVLFRNLFLPELGPTLNKWVSFFKRTRANLSVGASGV